jgi:hypothetical protein
MCCPGGWASTCNASLCRLTPMRCAVALTDDLDPSAVRRPPSAVRREFSVAEMDDLGLYKVNPKEDDDAFARVLFQLAHLRGLLPRRHHPGP